MKVSVTRMSRSADDVEVLCIGVRDEVSILPFPSPFPKDEDYEKKKGVGRGGWVLQGSAKGKVEETVGKRVRVGSG